MSSSSHSQIPRGWTALVALAGFLVALRPFSDIDFHWHLAMGRAYLEQGLWLAEDPLSYLPFVREVDMGAWGGQVLFAWAESLFGVAGPAIVVALVAAACHALVFRVAWRRCLALAPSLLACSVFAAASVHRWRGRPDVFSLLFFILMIGVLLRRDSKRPVAAFGLLGVLWINVHPGAIIMPLFALAAAFAGDRSLRLKQAGAAFLGCCLTPRGPLALADLVFHTVTTGPLVPEWRPLWQQPFMDFRDEWILLCAIVFLFLRTRPWPSRRPLSWLSLLWALRSFRLSYMLFVPILPQADGTVPVRSGRTTIVLAVVLFLILPLRVRLDAFQKSRDLGASPWTGLYEPAYPLEAAEFLATRELRGNLFHPVAWGGYLGIRLAPRNRSAHDGRISQWGHDLAAELLDDATPARREALRNKLGFEIVVAAPGYLSGSELVSNGGRWQPVYADNQAAVYVDVFGPNWDENAERLR